MKFFKPVIGIILIFQRKSPVRSAPEKALRLDAVSVPDVQVEVTSSGQIAVDHVVHVTHLLSADLEPKMGARFAIVKRFAEEPELASSTSGISLVVQGEALSELAVGRQLGVARVPRHGNAIKDGPTGLNSGNLPCTTWLVH